MQVRTVMLVISLVLVGGGLLLVYYGFPALINHNIAKTKALYDDSESMESWRVVPFPLDFKVYLWNVTNPSEVEKGARPVLEEIGPYTFLRYIERKRMRPNADDTITYMDKSTYHFSEAKSGSRRLSDVVTSLNLPLMSSAIVVEQIMPMALGILNYTIPHLYGKNSIFISTTVEKLLFKGVLIHCSKLQDGQVAMVCAALKKRTNNNLTLKKGSFNFQFSYFNYRNQSETGPYQVNRGRTDVSKLGKIESYQGNRSLTVWQPNSTCNELRGTDSTIFPPFLTPQTQLYIFNPGICSSVYAEFEKEEEFMGMPVYRFIGSPSMWADPRVNPGVRCRCPKDPDNPEGPPKCLKGGVIDASPCHGSPVIFSQPHLLDADPEYTSYAIGLKPDIAKHRTFVLMEPRTGTPLVGMKRLQMNMFLKRVEGIDVLANVTEGLLPLLWIEEGAELQGESLEKLEQFFKILWGFDVAGWSVVGAGVFLLICSTAFQLARKYNPKLLGPFGHKVAPTKTLSEKPPHLSMYTIDLASQHIPSLPHTN